MKPCPFCGGTEIEITLKNDCYSSWAYCECKCDAHLSVSVDEDNSCPSPFENWREIAEEYWNRDDITIYKEYVFCKRRDDDKTVL